MMQLMQKYVKDDGAVGIDNFDRWRNRPAAIEFLSATTSAGSIEELKKVCRPHFILKAAHWFLAASLDTNLLVAWRSYWPCILCPDVCAYILLVWTLVGWGWIGQKRRYHCLMTRETQTIINSVDWKWLQVTWMNEDEGWSRHQSLNVSSWSFWALRTTRLRRKRTMIPSIPWAGSYVHIQCSFL